MNIMYIMYILYNIYIYVYYIYMYVIYDIYNYMHYSIEISVFLPLHPSKIEGQKAGCKVDAGM